MSKIKNKSTSQVPTNQFSALSSFKKDIISIGFLFAIIVVMFSGVIFKNEVFSDGGDTAAAHAITQAGKILEEKEHIEPQWFPFIFSGMPSFGSLMYLAKDINYINIFFKFVSKILFLNAEMSWMIFHFLLGAVGVFIFIRYLGLTQIPSFIGALIFLMSPFILGLAQAGHGSKLMALSYIPYLFLGTKYLIDKKNLLSIGALGAIIGTLFLTNHVQMVYYGMMSVGFYFLWFLIQEFNNNVKNVAVTSGLFLSAIIIGFSIAAFIYLSTYEYSHLSVRGGGEAGAGGGMNIEAATNWSFHPLEMLTYFVPSFFGMVSPFYWGWMPFTESTMYIGLLPFLLAIFGIIFRRNSSVLFFASLSILYLLISFGKHFFVYDLLYNYLPFFNKFRAPQMILLLFPFSVGIIAAFGLDFLLKEGMQKQKNINWKKIEKGILITIGLGIVILIFSFMLKSSFFSVGSFVKDGDSQQYSVEQITQLKELRFEKLKDDAVKFSLFAIGLLAVVYFYFIKKITAGIFIFIIVTVNLIDVGIVDKSYLETKPNRGVEEQFPPTQTMKFLKQQSEKEIFRTFPVGQLFQDNTWMYHGLQTIGGYSPAKLRIYQEMLDSCLYKGWEENFPVNMNIVNMLNVKYVVAQGMLPPDKFRLVNGDKDRNEYIFENSNYLSRAFFVDSVIIAEKNKTYQILNSPNFNSRSMAILTNLPKEKISKSIDAIVKMENYSAHKIEIFTKNSSTSLLVLSEVFYPNGWKAFINGKETEIFKTNNLIRSIVVPAGNNKIEFEYSSSIYKSGLIISYSGWGVALILIFAGMYMQRKMKITYSSVIVENI
ncbi:MAG: YfhO family protein [Bacteroidota bacterium]